jgi:hypothetical protein
MLIDLVNNDHEKIPSRQEPREIVLTRDQVFNNSIDLTSARLWKTAQEEYAAKCSRVIPAYDLAVNPNGEPFPPPVAAEWARTVEGWMHPEELIWLAEQAARLQPGDVWVEVGAWKGRSTAAVVLAAGKDVVVCTVDTFAGSQEHIAAGLSVNDLRDCFLKTREKLGWLRPNGPDLLMHSGYSVPVAVLFDDASCAAVFIDAAHDYASVKADLEVWLPKVKPGGLLAGHDRNEPGVRQALNDALGGGQVHDGPGSLWWMRVAAVETVASGNGQKITAEG